MITTGLSTSLDGFIAGADDSPERPLGVGGDRLFEFELVQVVDAPGVTPLTYRVVK